MDSTGDETEIPKDTTKETNETIKRDDTEQLENIQEVSDSSNTEKGDDSKKIKTSKYLDFGEGPFEYNVILKDLPKNTRITCAEADDNHIYLGTDTGQLLHYYEIEGGTYLLVSMVPFSSEENLPIDRIQLLPNIDRALIFSNQKLILFLLPELAPCPNVVKLKGVVDFDIHSFSKTSNAYRIMVSTGDSLKMFKVASNSVSLVKSIENQSKVQKIRCHENVLLMAKNNEYEMLDLKTQKTIPLFRVTESGSYSISPLMVNFNKKAFLISSGGINKNDNAMGLVINHDGDITKATLVFEHYPNNIIVHYPYILVNFDDKEIYIYELQIDDEPKLVQKIKTKNSNLLLTRSLMKFGVNYSDQKVKEKLLEKIRKVPLLPTENNYGIQREKALASKLVEPMCSVLFWNNNKLMTLFTTPFLNNIFRYEDSEIKKIQEYIEHRNNSDIPSTDLQRIEVKYLNTLLLLWDLLNCELVDHKTINLWMSKIESVDIRILLYLLDFEIFGEVWLYGGLSKMVEKLKMLHLVNKCSDKSEIIGELRKITSNLETAFSTSAIKSKDLKSIEKTLEIAIFRYDLMSTNNIDMCMYDKEYYPEFIKIIQEESEPDSHNEMLIQIYKLEKKHIQVIDLLKSDNNISELLTYISENIGELPKNYIEKSLIPILLFVVRSSKIVNSKLITDIFSIMKSSNADVDKFLEEISSSTSLKVQILEVMGASNANDEHFLIDYYISKLRDNLEANNLMDLLLKFGESYKSDHTYTKMTLYEFLSFKIKTEDKFEEFRKIKQSCEKLIKDNDSLISEVFKKIQAFDENNLVSISLFFGSNVRRRMLWTDKRVEEILFEYLDLMSIEKILTKENFLSIFEKYLSFPNQTNTMEVGVIFLQRNQYLYQKNSDLIIRVLKTIPKSFPVSILVDLLTRILLNYKTEQTDLEFRKVLLKSELKNENNMIKQITSIEK